MIMMNGKQFHAINDPVDEANSEQQIENNILNQHIILFYNPCIMYHIS